MSWYDIKKVKKLAEENKQYIFGEHESGHKHAIEQFQLNVKGRGKSQKEKLSLREINRLLSPKNEEVLIVVPDSCASENGKRWRKLWGDRAHFTDRLVFVEMPCQSFWRYYKVYSIDDGDRCWFEVVYTNSGFLIAVVEEFGKRTEFYENNLGKMDWDTFSPIVQSNVFKEIEKAFIKQFPNAL